MLDPEIAAPLHAICEEQNITAAQQARCHVSQTLPLSLSSQLEESLGTVPSSGARSGVEASDPAHSSRPRSRQVGGHSRARRLPDSVSRQKATCARGLKHGPTMPDPHAAGWKAGLLRRVQACCLELDPSPLSDHGTTGPTRRLTLDALRRGVTRSSAALRRGVRAAPQGPPSRGKQGAYSSWLRVATP